jgi:hypothetical protein
MARHAAVTNDLRYTVSRYIDTLYYCPSVSTRAATMFRFVGRAILPAAAFQAAQSRSDLRLCRYAGQADSRLIACQRAFLVES